MLCILGCEVDLRQHTGDVRDDLVNILAAPGGFGALRSGGKGVQRDIVVLAEHTDQIVVWVTFPCDGVGQAVDGIAGRLAATGIQAFAGQSGCAHILHAVAVAVAQSFDVRGLWLTGNVRARQVICVVRDDLCKAAFLVAVVGYSFRAFRYLVGNREHAQGGQLWIVAVIGLALDIIELSGKIQARVLLAVKAHIRAGSDGGGNAGAFQCSSVRWVKCGMSIVHLVFSFPYSLFAGAAVLCIWL